jgi:AcrR family transcriptional regulator
MKKDRPGKRSVENLADRILNSAQRLFYNNGYLNTKVEEIAKQARTSASGIVRTFGSKHGVLTALYERSWKKIEQEVFRALDSCSSDPREKLLTMARVMWTCYQESQEDIFPIILDCGVTDCAILNRSSGSVMATVNVKYLDLVNDLCAECINLDLVDKRLTSRALREGVFGIVEGVLLGWYQEDWSTGRDKFPERISIDDAVTLLTMLLYGRLE